MSTTQTTYKNAPINAQVSTWPLVIEDNHVKICAMATEHLHGLHQAGNTPEIWRWTSAPYCLSEQSTQEWLTSCLAQAKMQTLSPFVIIDKALNKIVGATCYLNIAKEHKCIEIGYTFLHPSAQKTHINRRCKLLLLSYAFEQLKYNRVALQTHEKNLKSRTAIEGIGAVYEGIQRNCRIQHDGSVRSSVYYSIIKAEWPQVKLNLQSKIAARKSSINSRQ